MEIKLGQLITNTDSHRDAIHVPVLPVKSGEDEQLKAGDFIMFSGENVYKCPKEKAHGIVDPFLDVPLNGGDMFWMLMMPGSVTSLRHQWHHSSIPLDAETYLQEDDGCRGCY